MDTKVVYFSFTKYVSEKNINIGAISCFYHLFDHLSLFQLSLLTYNICGMMIQRCLLYSAQLDRLV